MRALVVCLFVLTASGCTSVGYKLGIASCAPVYGNWCGENYPLAGSSPKAVDDWDAACRSHDKCYDSGGSRSSCDRALVKELESLSRNLMAPIRMYNAHSWFKKGGSVVAWLQFTDEWWGMFASCRGGDGRAARFGCATGWTQPCRLDADDGPGQAVAFCTCNGFPGRVFEH